MNSNVINVRKNFLCNYQYQIMIEKKLILVLIVEVQIRKGYFQVLQQLLQKKPDDVQKIPNTGY